MQLIRIDDKMGYISPMAEVKTEMKTRISNEFLTPDDNIYAESSVEDLLTPIPINEEADNVL